MPFVRELSEYVSKLNDEIESGAPDGSTKVGKKQEESKNHGYARKLRADEVMELKKITANDTSAAGGEAVKQTSTSSSNIHQDNSDVKKKQPKERTQEGYENYYKKKLFSSLTDEEKKQKKENIESSVVSEIKKDSVPYDNSGVYDKAGKAWLKANPQKDAITPIGEIIINEKSVLRDMHHGEPADKYLKLQTLPAVKDVLEKGTYLGYEDDFDGKPIDNHYFAGKIKYGDKEKIVFCRVRENAGGEGRFYVHEVFTEDEIKRDFLAPIDGSLPRLTGKPLYKFILQDVLNVKKKQERRAKVVKSHGYDDLPEDLKNEDTKKLFEYMDSHPSNNADIDFLYSNLGGILPKNVTIYADTKRRHYIPSEKSVRINPIKDANDTRSIETALHELGHAIDYASVKKEDTGRFGDRQATFRDGDKLRSAIQNNLIKELSPDTLSFISQSEDIVAGKSGLKRQQDLVFEEGDKVKKDLADGKIERKEAVQKVNELNKQLDKNRKEWGKKIDAAGIPELEDIYDALSGGKLRSNGTLTYWHGTNYKKVNERASEMFANYLSLSFTHPDFIDNYLRKDAPEVCKEMDGFIRDIADTWRKKLGKEEKATIETLKDKYNSTKPDEGLNRYFNIKKSVWEILNGLIA